jgi:hypothetical protein
MKRYKLVENDNIQYACVLLGGSIGNKSISNIKSLKDEEVMDLDRLFDSKEKAKEKVDRMNKILSPGEKKYYGMEYVIAEVINNKYTGK